MPRLPMMEPALRPPEPYNPVSMRPQHPRADNNKNMEVDRLGNRRFNGEDGSAALPLPLPTATQTTPDISFTTFTKTAGAGDIVFTTVVLAPGTTTTYVIPTSTAPPNVTAPELSPDFPNLPPMFKSFLFAWLLFAWLCATILYFAQFPDQLDYLHNFFRAEDQGEQQQAPQVYVRVPLDEEPDADSPSSGSKTKPKDIELTHMPESATIGASLGIPGLGISLQSPGLRLRRRRSFSTAPTADPPRSSNPGEPLQTLTAPLTTVRSLASLTRRRSPSTSDLENGLSTPNTPGSRNERDERYSHTPGRDVEGKRGVKGFLESVNAGLEYAVDYVARLAYDHVRDGEPEVELLLPVRAEEREGAGW